MTDASVIDGDDVPIDHEHDHEHDRHRSLMHQSGAAAWGVDVRDVTRRRFGVGASVVRRRRGRTTWEDDDDGVRDDGVDDDAMCARAWTTTDAMRRDDEDEDEDDDAQPRWMDTGRRRRAGVRGGCGRPRARVCVEDDGANASGE